MSAPHTHSARDARVFWLTLPPLDAPARLAAARLLLRDRVANPAAAVLALGSVAGPHGMWCVAVMGGTSGVPERTHINATAHAATTPWTRSTLTWRRSATDPHCITARGESVALEATDDDALPDLLVSAAGAPGVQSILIVTDAHHSVAELLRQQWQAALGVPVTLQPYASATPSAAWMPNFATALPLVVPAARGEPLVHRAGWIAAAAAAVHLALSGLSGWQAAASTRDAHAAQASLATQSGTTLANWRAHSRASAPTRARDSASSALAVVTPALTETATQLVSLHFESNALSVEWRALSEPQRLRFIAAVQAHGASVVSANQRARVVWP